MSGDNFASEVTVRMFEERDADAVAEIQRETIRKINSRDYRDEIIEIWSQKDPKDYKNWKKIESVFQVVAEVDDKVIGWGCLNLEENEIKAVYVDPDYLGNGIGTKMIAKIEKKAKDEGLEKLKCFSTETALDFYKAKGYQVEKETKFPMGDYAMDSYLMVKNLEKNDENE